MPISRIIRPNHMIRSSLEPGLSDVANISPNLVSWLLNFLFGRKVVSSHSRHSNIQQ